MPTDTVLAQAETIKTVIIFPASAVLSPEEVTALAECVGEEVTFTEGAVEMTIHLTILPGGEAKFSIQAVAKGITGTGLTSGATYRLTGALSLKYEEPVAPPLRFSFLDHLNIIGPGQANNLRLFYQTHLTVNANGEVTAFMDNFRARCR
jgi:hypothetical protein